MSKSCLQIEPLIAGLVDGELGEVELREVQAHVGTCQQCASVLEAQKVVKQNLKENYRLEVAPIHLRARIRRDLSEAAGFPGFLESLASVFKEHRMKGAFATLALAMILAVPYTGVLRQNLSSSSIPKLVSIEGEVLCFDCEVLKTAGYAPEHADDHRLGVKDKNGIVWRIVDSSAGKKIVHDFSLRGEHIQLSGYSFNGSLGHNIDVKGFKKL